MTVSWGGYESLLFPVAAVHPADSPLTAAGRVAAESRAAVDRARRAAVLIRDLEARSHAALTGQGRRGCYAFGMKRIALVLLALSLVALPERARARRRRARERRAAGAAR